MMNLPNQITMVRLFIAILLFCLLSVVEYFDSSQYVLLMNISLFLFVFAVLSDFLDGYIARKYNLCTTFGRIADPLVDKIVICGVFIFFISLTSLVASWMVVVIIAREMIVSGLRSYMESLQIQFGADWGGKFKMFFQSMSGCLLFLYLGHFQEFSLATTIMQIFIWLTVIVTAISGISYIYKASKIFRNPRNIS